MYELIEELKKESVKQLKLMLQEVLAVAEKGVVDQIGGFLQLSQNREEIMYAFVTNMNNCFDELMDKPIEKPELTYNFETLSLVQDDDLEIMVALDGMVNYARNENLPVFISFNTRLNSLFENKRIDESTNPLDPHQIAEAFKEAIMPLGMDAQNSLAIYRAFNREILHNIDSLLSSANKLLIDAGVLPDLGQPGAQKEHRVSRRVARTVDSAAGFGTVEEDPYEQDEDNPELFSMMQDLLHPSQFKGVPATSDAPPPGSKAAPGQTGGAPAEEIQQYAIPASMLGGEGKEGGGPMQLFTPKPGEQVQTVDQAQLMSILTNIQKTLEQQRAAGGERKIPEALEDVERLDVASHLGEMLKEDQKEGVVNAVDRQSSDIINLVTMLYEAIWDDESVPIPIKELIGRTQVTIIKVALSDQTFFNKERHPARMVLNEFAAAGIGWTEVEHLEQDPLYKEIQKQVNRVIDEYDGNIELFEKIIEDFRAFRAKEAAKTRVLEQKILRAKERQERIDDINQLVTERIEERLLGRELDPFINELLHDPFHKFMVMLVLKEGPGTNAWKQAINTIDVLLWTVQPHEHAGDRSRLDTVNPRLLNNLKKAFRIAKIESAEIERLIGKLKEVQNETFGPEPEPEPEIEETAEEEDSLELDLTRDQERAEHKSAAKEAAATDQKEGKKAAPVAEEEKLDESDPAVKQVDNLSVGLWVEFVGEDETPIRCKLAARINAIDKYIFVNRQGVKVVEKTRMGLAQELRDGTVKIISDGLLFSRALESVIGNLRETQHEQQTGSAYHPDAAQSPS